MKALERSLHYTLIFQTFWEANSVVSDGIWPIFELIQAFMVALATYKNDEDPFKNEGTRVVTTFIKL